MKISVHAQGVWLIAIAVMVNAWGGNASGEVLPFDVTLPSSQGRLGPDFGKKTIQFSGEIGFHLGQFQAEPDGVSPSSVLGHFSILQPLKHHEAEFVFSFVQYGLEVPAAEDFGQAEAVDQSSFRLGNPALYYFFPWRTLSRQIRLGLGVTAPLAHLRDDRIERTRADAYAYEGASAMKGHRSPWLWMPRTVSTIGHFDVFLRGSSGFILGLELDAAAAMRTAAPEENGVSGITSTPDSVDVIAQAMLNLAFDAELVKTSIVASYVTAPLKDLEAGLNDQIATSVDFRIRLGQVDFLTSVFIPIDEPAGFAFDSDRHWSLNFGFGTATKQRLPK